MQKGNTIYLEPNGSLMVRAIKDCKILGFIDDNSSKVIVAKGKIEARHGNLNRSNVSKGDIVLKRQIMGELFYKDSVSDNSLSVSLKKDGKPIMPR